jgi:hypothetical protein
MENKNLIIVPSGDNSLHNNWLGENNNFDLIIIYYGDSDEIFEKYSKECKMIIRAKGQKWHLIHDFISENDEVVSNYEYIWFPDDDLDSNSESLNNLSFNLPDLRLKFNLFLIICSRYKEILYFVSK